MARKSGPRQLKRELSPAFWPIDRKNMTWAPRTRPGPHRRENSLPLVIVIRDILGHAQTAREAIHIISSGKVKVDGVTRKDHRYPIGLMDVLQIEGSGESFRLLPKPNVGLTPARIDEKEATFKICKIIGKKSVSRGRTQLNLHDGRSLILQLKDPRQKAGEEYSVGGALQLGFPAQKILAQVPFQTGALGLVVDGRNQGLLGRIEAINLGSNAREKSVRIQTTAGSFETPANYVIPVGTNAAIIGLEKK
jgi:small subunit ribosomal protein S4e